MIFLEAMDKNIWDERQRDKERLYWQSLYSLKGGVSSVLKQTIRQITTVSTE